MTCLRCTHNTNNLKLQLSSKASKLSIQLGMLGAMWVTVLNVILLLEFMVSFSCSLFLPWGTNAQNIRCLNQVSEFFLWNFKRGQVLHNNWIKNRSYTNRSTSPICSTERPPTINVQRQRKVREWKSNLLEALLTTHNKFVLNKTCAHAVRNNG